MSEASKKKSRLFNKKHKAVAYLLVLVMLITTFLTTYAVTVYAAPKFKRSWFDFRKFKVARTIPSDRGTTPAEPTTPTEPATPAEPTTPTEPATPAEPTEPADNAPIVTGAYYVSKTGNDSNPGTSAQPWRTIQKAVDNVKAGDTVYIREGSYNERVILKKSGTSDNYITFSNYPGETVTIDGTGISWGYDWDCLFDLATQSYIKINGLKVINSSWFGIGDGSGANGSQHIIIKNCSTYNTQSSGIAFGSGGNIIVDSNTIEKACISGSQEGITLENVNTYEIKNNTVFDLTKEGIDVKNGSSNGKIHNNTVHHSTRIGIYLDAFSRTQENIEVYNNTIYNCDQGISVATEYGGLLANVNIHDNTIKDCYNGLEVTNYGTGNGHAMDRITFNHNILSGTIGKGMYLCNPEAKNVVITNNVFGGTSTSIPIFNYGANLNETTIDGNTLNRIVEGHPTGTNYTLL